MDQEFFAELSVGESKCCPTCGRYAKIYRRSLHCSVALQLIRLHNLGGIDAYVSASRLIPPGNTGVGDFTKAKYWSLIEHSEGDGSMWRLTFNGLMFVRGNARIQKYAMVYDDRVQGFDGDPVTIRECLEEKYNYEDLMAL